VPHRKGGVGEALACLETDKDRTPAAERQAA